MCRKFMFFLTSFVLIMALATVTGADWVAYNDLSDGNGGTAALGLNVTTYTYLDTNKALMDFDTGATLTVTMTGEIVGDNNANGDVYPNNGGNCDAGTDADNIFGGILDLTGGNELDTTAEHKAIIFNGLNPGMSYTITVTSNRDNLGYTNRWSRVTIEGADAYTYAASAGVKKLSEASGEFCVGSNSVTGYVMKWTDISCGADGSFSIKTENADYGAKGYAMMAFKLEEYTLTSAADPSPADGATDVPRDVVLSWTPGMFAPAINGHKVYFGENFNDINDGIGGIAQSADSYTPAQRLGLGTTYYWRVDEVNGPPDYTVYEGEVWSFTTEPVGYPIENVTVTASSQAASRGVENTVNGSGLDESGLLHVKDGDDTMWLSGMAGPQPTWVEFEFDKVCKLHELWVWNANDGLEPMIGFGFKDVTIEYSVDGIDYTTLGTTVEFARAPGMHDYAHNTTIDMGGVSAKYVRLTANSNWGGILPQYGLSEVRFLYVPVQAREPRPADGETDVDVDVTLGFRAGREAARHEVYFSSDEQAVTDGTAAVTTATETSYSPLLLDLGKTYYWRVDEVNEAETTNMWQGEIWDFTTQEYFAVDDFESYNDLDTTDPESKRIFNVWMDGYGVATNGSLVGYEVPPFCEKTIVHGGRQSMPFFYSNTGGAASSEAELTLSPAQDWTAGGAKVLSLWFFGDASNTAAQMYVKVNGTKVAYDGNAGNLALSSWQVWNIDLASSGAGLQSVTKLSVGIDGNGATGKLYLDDIRLYALAPAPVNEWSIAAGSDDAEEHVLDGGNMEGLGSSDLELGYEGAMAPAALQTIGCRWVGIPVPKGATITEAWVQFSADDVDNTYHEPDVSLIIEGELSPNPATFSSTASDISSRPTTTSQVVWDIPRWMTVHAKGPEERTPDISSIIQEIVNQDGWAGNAIVLMFRDNPAKPSAGTREAEAFDGSASEAPLLHISYQ